MKNKVFFFQNSRCERVNLKIDHVLWNKCKHGRILEVFPLTFMMEMTKNDKLAAT